MKKFVLLSGLTLFFGLFTGQLLAQDTGEYLLGEEEKLQIVVYILGEVHDPGEYRVSDNTNVVELISKAGGTTDFANLGKVRIRREFVKYDPNSPRKVVQKEFLKFDAKKYLENQGSPDPPVLKPGDIVYVGRNNWSKWRKVAAVVRDVSVVATAVFLYFRTFENK